MSHGIKPGDYVVGDPSYRGWTRWFLDEFVKTQTPVKVLRVNGDSIEIHLSSSSQGAKTFWSSIGDKYRKYNRPCPMEVKS